MTEAQFDKIEDFLDGKIERSDLTAGLTEPELSELDQNLAFVKNARLAVEVSQIRSDLTQLHQEATASTVKAPGPTKPVGKVRTLPKWLLAVAAVAILLIAFFTFLPREQDLYADFQYQDPGLPVVMGISDNPLFAEAMTLFKQGDYVAASQGFKAQAEASPLSDTLQYYLGASYYYAEDYSAARKPLQTVTESAGSLLLDRAEWLLVLTHLRLGDEETAATQLDGILQQPNHRFGDLAGQLRETLRQE